MKFAIIAAGEGSRLAQEGVARPKPLVCLNGEPMIHRLIRIFCEAGAEEVVVIVNRLHPETEEYVRTLMETEFSGLIRLVVKTTPSSMHSFSELAPYLEDGPFCLTTVDTIFREDEFQDYIGEFERSDYDGLMAVTSYVDDEKPLYVGVGEGSDLRITGFYDTEPEDCRFISGGIYALRPRALQTLRRCMAEGQSRMRNFQRGLIQDGLRIHARPFSKILDVDHAGDILKAEDFLNLQNVKRKEILGISRSPRFSPASVERDKAIFDAVCRRLSDRAEHLRTLDEDELSDSDLRGYSDIFSMARGQEALRLLAGAEMRGTHVLNSALSIQHFTRARLVECFSENSIPQPPTAVISLKRGDAMPPIGFPLWLKRGNACAQELDDVCHVPTPAELPAALEGFRSRGLDEIVVCQHVEGDLVKFYGVEGTDFFYFCYPTRGEHFSKFGFERLNGAPKDYAFSRKKLKETADKAARLSGFTVYGGDCIVRSNGTFVIIDFNDWPSFSPCCEEASAAIASRI
ncbi:MAG: NTP transferase domain-containing protein [Alloprevotella sp.]|nr:NTP transferase domain-containing protein [Alloprevotella sp.]